MSKQPEHEGAQRFGGEFGPKRCKYNRCFTVHIQDSSMGLKHWRFAIGCLCTGILFVQQEFAMGLGFLIAGVIVALSPQTMKLEEWKKNLLDHLTSNFSPQDGHLTLPVYPVGTFNGELQCTQLITTFASTASFCSDQTSGTGETKSAMSTIVLR